MLTTMSITLMLALLAGLSLGLGVIQIASMRKISRLHQALTEVSARQETLLRANSGATSDS